MPPKRPTLADVRSWPATISVVEAADALGCSKTFLYERIKRGDSPVKTLAVGERRYVVITADLIRLLSGEERAIA
ncbi:DNA-binding protein [Streptomyces sp. NBC_01439]|uniref:DNA-binding protein n=1 Tax=Streptomyces sp. NBC_01439 TaxID=2903867 RepID=UPI002E2CD20D|nr:DNA-binding protein [Streptomyces sp. NBC_01439]